MRHVLIAVVTACSALFIADPALAAKRVALVIGVDRYEHLAPLANPGRDAEALAGVFEDSGFETFFHIDLDQAALDKVLADFAAKAAGADQAVVYYAGHGMSVVRDGRLVNVIAPSDAKISCANRSASRVLAMDRFFSATAGIPERVFLFDACRNDPFRQCAAESRIASRGFGFRAVGQEALVGKAADVDEGEKRGFSRTQAVRSAAALIAFSTDLGAVALDGKPGAHSPFADELLKQLGTAPDLPIREVLDRASQAVAKRTAYLQVPWVVSKGGEPQLCLSGNCRTRKRLETGRLAAEVSILLKQARDRIAGHDYDGALVYGTEALSLSQNLADKKQRASAEEAVRTSLAERRPFRELSGSTAHVTKLEFSSSGHYAMALSNEPVKLLTRIGSPGWDFVEPPSKLDRTLVEAGKTSTGLGINPKDVHKKGRVPASKNFRTVRVWDARTGKALHLFRDYEGDLIQAFFRGRTNEIVTVNLKGRITVWDIRTGKRKLRTRPLRHGISTVAISRDGRRLAMGSGDQDDGGMNPVLTMRGVSYVVNLKTGKRVARVKTAGQLGSLALSPDGKLLSVAFTDKNRGFVWSLKRKRRHFSTSVSSFFKSIQTFSQDGRYLALTRSGHVFDVYDVKKRRKLKRAFVHRPGSFIGDLVFDAGRPRIASFAGNREVFIWRLDEAVGRTTIDVKDGELSQVRFSDDGKSLFVGVGQLVRIVDLASRKTRALLSVKGVTKTEPYSPVIAKFNHFAEDPKSGRLLVKFDDAPLRQYLSTDVGGGLKVSARLSNGSDFAGYARSGKWLILNEGGRLRILDAATGAKRKDIKFQYSANAPPNAKLTDIRGTTNDPGSLSGKVAFVGTDRDIGILQLPDLRILKVIPSDGRQVDGARISPDGRLVMIAQQYRPIGRDTCDNSVIRIVRLADLGGFEFCGPYFDSFVGPPSFSPDSSHLVSVGHDSRLRIFDVETRRIKELTSNRKFRSRVSPVFTADGKNVVVPTAPQGVSIIRVADGKELVHVPDTAGSVSGVAASYDGKRIAVAGGRQVVHVIDAATGLVQEIYKGFGKLSIGAFDPSNTGLAMASFTAVETRSFQLAGDALLQHAREHSPGCLAKSARDRLKLQSPVPQWCTAQRKVAVQQ